MSHIRSSIVSAGMARTADHAKHYVREWNKRTAQLKLHAHLLSAYGLPIPEAWVLSYMVRKSDDMHIAKFVDPCLPSYLTPHWWGASLDGKRWAIYIKRRIVVKEAPPLMPLQLLARAAE